jgi:hypothetical protein
MTAKPACGAEMFAERIRIMGADKANAATGSYGERPWQPWAASVMILAGLADDGRPWLWLACCGCGWFVGLAGQYEPQALADDAGRHACRAARS